MRHETKFLGPTLHGSGMLQYAISVLVFFSPPFHNVFRKKDQQLCKLRADNRIQISMTVKTSLW